MLCRCLVYTKRLSRAKQALAQSFSRVSVASDAFQHWRKLSFVCSPASAAASSPDCVEHAESLTPSEGSVPESVPINLQIDGKSKLQLTVLAQL